LKVTKYNSSFTHTITYKCGTASGAVCTKSSAATVDWTADNGNTVELASQNKTGPNVKVTFTITTYSGSTTVGSESTSVTMAIPENIVPSVTLIVEEATPAAEATGLYVQGVSTLRITAVPTLAGGSPIKTYSITADGKTYNTDTVVTDPIQGKGTMTITAKVTDERSRTSEEFSVDIFVWEYSKPSVTAIAYRCNSSGEEDPEGAYMRIGFSTTVTELEGRNAFSYKVTGGSHTFTGVNATSYLSGVLACDVSYAWPVEVTFKDDFSATTRAAVIPIAFTLMDFYHTGMGVAFGKVATRDGFDCAMPAYFTGGVYVDGKSLAEYITELANG
jgi:hypothetical protein